MCQNVSKKPFLAILSDFGGFWVSFLHFLAHLKPQITYIDVFWAEKSIQHIFGTIRRCLRALFDIFNLFWRFWPKPPNLPLWWGYLSQGLKFRKKNGGLARHGTARPPKCSGTARHAARKHESEKNQKVVQKVLQSWFWCFILVLSLIHISEPTRPY